MDLHQTKSADELGTMVGPRSRATSGSDHALPDEPLVIIKRDRSWSLDLAGLWSYRELLYFLIWRDLKVRYKQTVLGTLWSVMQPLLMTVIFTVFLGLLARVPSDQIPYAIFVNAGLLPWTFFSSAVVTSGNSLVGSSQLITKVYFPRLIIPAAAIGARLVDFAIAFVILGGLIAYYRVQLTSNLLFLPVVVLLVAVLSLAVGMLSSAWNVKYRDVSVILPVVIQVWMFISPVVYPASLVPQKWRWLYALNPMAGIIEGFRSSVLGRPFDWVLIGISAVITLVLSIYAFWTFQRMERSFADVI